MGVAGMLMVSGVMEGECLGDSYGWTSSNAGEIDAKLCTDEKIRCDTCAEGW